MAEWRLQPLFSKLLIAGGFLLLGGSSPEEFPNREPGPAREVALRLEPLELPPAEGVAIAGAWTIIADDSRVEGLSALAILPGGMLQALSDSGSLMTFPRPGGGLRALVSDLAGGPGYPTFKKYRDSEAMLVDPDGRGRLVAFEYRHSLWRYPATGEGAAVPISLPSARWRKNTGIEAMVREPGSGDLLLLHEGGRQIFRVRGNLGVETLPLAGATGGIADAVVLPDGRMAVAVREIGLTGLTNRLAWLERDGSGYRLRNFASLPLGHLDNVEGLAAERGADGRIVLWAVTDSDGWRRTLLIRLVLDTRKAPA